MDTNSYREDEEANPKKDALPRANFPPGSFKDEWADDPKQQITASSVERSCADHKQREEEPLRVHITKDDDLSSFEKRTIILGKWGLCVAGLSLVAAIGAGYFVYQQFSEMQIQTAISSAVAERARIDSNESSKAVANQISILQAQLRQQQLADRMSERAWIEIDPITPVLYGKDNPPNLFRYDLYIRNIGNSAARNVVVSTDNGAQNRGSIENTRNAEWIHNVQDMYLLGKFKNGVIHRKGGPAPSVLGPHTVSPVPVTFVDQEPQVFPSGFMAVSEILGRVDYADEFGVQHWRRFCFYIGDSKGNLVTCEAGNDEDHNPELIAPRTRKTN